MKCAVFLPGARSAAEGINQNLVRECNRTRLSVRFFIYMAEIEVNLNRLGKIALIAAASDDNEEEVLKGLINIPGGEYRLAITFISGMTDNVKSSFVKSIIGCALQNELVEKKNTEIHAIIHAGLDALGGILHQVGADSSLKMKVAIVRDRHWVAVALYGDSAYNPLTNHERASLGIMHIG